MIFTMLSLWLALNSSAVPLTISREGVGQFLADSSGAGDFDIERSVVWHPSRTFGYAGRGREVPFSALKDLAPKLYRRYGYRLVYLKRVAGAEAPAFDGVVLNQAGHVVANLALGQTSELGIGDYAFARRIRSLNSHTRDDGWINSLFLQARRLAGVPPRARVVEVELTDPVQVRAFGRIANAYRVQREAFAVGARRPTWLFVRAGRWRPSDQMKLSGFVPAGSVVTRVFVQHGRLFRDLTAGCLADLGAEPLL